MTFTTKDIASAADDAKMILVEDTSLVAGDDLYVGREPPDPDNCVTLFDTPGEGPLLFQHRKNSNGKLNKYDYAAFSARIRHRDYDTGYKQAKEVAQTLHMVSHRTVGVDRVHLIEALDDPSLLDWDEKNRARFVVNFAIQRKPEEKLAETTTYQERVEADGGSVHNLAAVNEFIGVLKDNNIWDNLEGCYAAEFGVKNDGDTKTSKLYSLKGTADATPRTTPGAPWVEEGYNGRATLEVVGKNYDISGAEDWLKGSDSAWAFGLSHFLDEVNTKEFIALDPPGGAYRFALVRRNDDKLVLHYNIDDDFSAATLSSTDTYTGDQWFAFSGFVSPPTQKAETWLSNVNLREFSGSAVQDFSTTDVDAAFFLIRNKFAFLMYAKMEPTDAQRTAVWDWLNEHYSIT